MRRFRRSPVNSDGGSNLMIRFGIFFLLAATASIAEEKPGVTFSLAEAQAAMASAAKGARAPEKKPAPRIVRAPITKPD